MQMFAYMWLAFRSLRLYALRSLVAIIGIAIGVATFLDVVAVTEGARTEVSRHISVRICCLLSPAHKSIRGFASKPVPC